MRREDQPRAGVGGLEHAAQPGEDRAQPLGAAAQRGRRLIALAGGRRPHLAMDVVEQRLRAVRGDEQAEHLVEAAAIQVGIEITQARRQAAAHLAVGRGVVAAGQPPAAVAQPEQRVELLDELERQPPTPHRPDRDRVPGGRIRGHLEDRKRDVETAADVDEPVVGLVSRLLPGGLSSLISRFSSTSAPSSDSVVR